MEIQKDFKEFIELLNSAKAEYVIVGGYAVAFHGAPRFTGDIDILINRQPGNSEILFKVLADFGFAGIGITKSDLMTEDQVIQMGRPPARIDLLTSISGVTWDEVWQNRIEDVYGGLPVSYIGKHELLRNKRATGRMKDLMDIEALQ